MAPRFTVKDKKHKERRSPNKVTQRGSFIVDDVDFEELGKFISKCHAHGAAVMLTQNRDRTVFGVRLYHDDVDNQTVWINSIEDLRALETFVEDLVDDVAD